MKGKLMFVPCGSMGRWMDGLHAQQEIRQGVRASTPSPLPRHHQSAIRNHSCENWIAN
jgi:hypothetical protein